MGYFESLFKKVFVILFGDSESLHRGRLMKTLVKDNKGSRFKKFYKIFTHDVTPQFALYFYELYKSCANLQNMLHRIDESMELKTAVLACQI